MWYILYIILSVLIQNVYILYANIYLTEGNIPDQLELAVHQVRSVHIYYTYAYVYNIITRINKAWS